MKIRTNSKINIKNVVLLFFGIFAGMMLFINSVEQYDFTLEDFYKIEDGMTYEEVTSVLGGDGELLNRDRNNPKFTYTYYTWNSEYGGSVSINFTNDKVTNKAEHNLKKLDEINR